MMTRIDQSVRPRFSTQNGSGSGSRSDPLPRLLTQILQRAGENGTVERAISRPWASALFEGRRHIIMLRISGEHAEQQAHCFAYGIEDAEWDLAGHFVADITIDDICPSTNTYLIELSALTIEDW